MTKDGELRMADDSIDPDKERRFIKSDANRENELNLY